VALRDIAILTENRYLKPRKKDWYVGNIITEDSLVQSGLESLGFNCKRVAWDDCFDPSRFRFALFRTTWNYFEQLGLFRSFLKDCSDKIIFINPYEQVLWNLNKRYLLWLRDRGINIPPTYLVKKGSDFDLLNLCNKNGWPEVVIKPCVSAAAWNTHYIKSIGNRAQSLFNSLIKNQDMLIQVFQKNIIVSGEISIMIINGKYSHSVLKHAKDGDFRVQDDFGGTVSAYRAKKAEIKFAENVIKTLPFSPIYARVDLVLDNNNEIALSELELIEPEMWFRLNPLAARDLAIAIRDFININ
jgi:glutathione synthase/RimK-type ligase-like ATP-grasp enzyme